MASEKMQNWSLILPPRTSPAVRLAVRALKEGTTPNRPAREATRVVKTSVDSKVAAYVGHEGFQIRKETPRRITVAAASPSGLANGVFAMARRLRKERRSNPFDLSWALSEKPHFENRGMWLLHFLPQYTHLTIDGFTLDDWKSYIDFLRSLGANSLCTLNLKMVCPDEPTTDRYRHTFETMRHAMRHAQRLGMKFTLMIPHNLVPPEVWWRHPELRAQTRMYNGMNLCPHKGREKIKEAQRPFLDFFKEMDALSYMYLDGGGECYCECCKDRLAETILESTQAGCDLLREVGSKARFVPFTWIVDRRPGGALEHVLRELPPEMQIVDSPVNFPAPAPHLNALAIAKKAGRHVTNFFFFTDPEGGMEIPLSVFPNPRLAALKKEIRSSKKLRLDGVVGYRMAPPINFLCDNAIQRLAWNPGMTLRQVVRDIADRAVSKPAHRDRMRRAIWALETFWIEHDLDALREADVLFRQTLESQSPPPLRHNADGVNVLLLLAEIAHGTKGKAVTMQEKMRVWDRMKNYYIYQGYTTDGGWEGRGRAVLFPMIDAWVANLRYRRSRKDD